MSGEGDEVIKRLFLVLTFIGCVFYRANVGEFTFQEAFDRTGRILNIVVTPVNSSDPPRLLNYLTAPHVMIWSAVVASCSLPGVFEANRLIIKEADGWERYENSQKKVHYCDGSMEQDLPMQQLTEMFNVNHFIVSQANPHAVMLASYLNRHTVWHNPLIGFAASTLRFLRDEVRSWLGHLMSWVGARRIAPFFATERGTGFSILTQEYEGRSVDISLIPWLGHRSILSACLHAIYNPDPDEFLEWVYAAARETWKHLPVIKSHIAEEVTLDRCVQRLRKRLVKESFDRQQQEGKVDSGGHAMKQRVPSFFNSPSLVNLGGMSVADKPEQPLRPHFPKADQLHVDSKEYSVDVNSGWGGLGLKGNRSSGNLIERVNSAASGLFIEDETSNGGSAGFLPKALSGSNGSLQVTGSLSNGSPSVQQHAGQDTSPPSGGDTLKNSGSSSSSNLSGGPYLKTSNMADFYYRKDRNNQSNTPERPAQ